MARIIDKEEKRSEIARASIELFASKGIAQTSIDEIAKSAGVAKGTVYLYFKNKEEIIFAIWDMLSENHKERYQTRIVESMSAKEKILELFNFTECEKEYDQEDILALYQHFVSTLLVDKSGLYTAYFENVFQRDYDIVSACLKEGIEKGEFVPMNIDMLATSVIIFMEGILVKAKMSNMRFMESQTLLIRYITFLLEPYERKAS
jgi:TetR/AcrR family acrAB operon transcriptional repressor